MGLLFAPGEPPAGPVAPDAEALQGRDYEAWLIRLGFGSPGVDVASAVTVAPSDVVVNPDGQARVWVLFRHGAIIPPEYATLPRYPAVFDAQGQLVVGGIAEPVTDTVGLADTVTVA